MPAGLGLILAIAGVFFVTHPAYAQRKKTSKRPAIQRETHSDPIEALVERARPAIVVISHLGRDGSMEGLGTGFVVAADGLIATSLHVIGEARPIQVELANGKRHEVLAIHAWDRTLDLAVVRVGQKNLPSLSLGDSAELKPGRQVIAIGHPLGLEHSVVQGTVSAIREFESSPMIQLAIPIELGNSGGPLLDLEGRVQGILNMKSAFSENVGFAMPVNALKKLLNKPNPVPMNRWLAIGALDSNHWNSLFGARWSQKTGRIHVSGSGTGFGGRSLCLSQQQVPQVPYEVAVGVRLDDESGAAGLAFAADGGNRHYGFYPSAGQLRLTRFEGSNVFSWTILHQQRSPHYRPRNWNTLKVRVEKEKIVCYVNGYLVFEKAENRLDGGQAGLVKFRETKAEFRHFQIGQEIALPVASVELEAKLSEKVDAALAGSQPADAKLIGSLVAHSEASRLLLLARAEALEARGDQLRKLAAKIHRQWVDQELAQALQGSGETIDLFHAALLIAKLDNPDIDLEAYRNEVDQMASAIRSKLPSNAPEEKLLDALTEYLFVENGFHGSRTDYYNRSNSYLNEVLDDREGIPITLSVLYLELGRRVGIKHLSGVSVPGHFMVQFAPESAPKQLIDVFDGGKRISRQAADVLAQSYTGTPLGEEHLQPATTREIIARMLRNLVGIAMRSQSAESALAYLDLLIGIDPESGMERWRRGMLRLQSGDVEGAKQDLRWLLHHQPRGIELEQVEELLRSL